MDDLIALRRHLHAHPELSNEEHETANELRMRLQALPHPPELISLGGTGFAAVFRSSESPKSDQVDALRAGAKKILLRCELDALPIAEVNSISYASVRDAVSHKCGHDGHMTILFGVACWLSSHLPLEGEAILLFQSAEETGDGAKEAIEHPNFSLIKPDSVFALHNLPGRPMHHVFLRNGTITPSVKSLILRFKGKTSHAAEPENGYNPAQAMAFAITEGERVTLNDPASDDFFLVTPVYQEMGDKAYGISAGYGEVHLTIRSWSEPLFNEKCDAYLEAVRAKCHDFNLELETEWCYEFQSNVNDNDATDVVREAAKAAGCKMHELKEPFKFGEDFGIFTQEFPGTMFGLGSGEDTPALHNPDYDFPDELIATGIALFTEILKNQLTFV